LVRIPEMMKDEERRGTLRGEVKTGIRGDEGNEADLRGG